MERVVSWTELVTLVSPYLPEGRRGRLPFPVEAMLRIHAMQQWFNLSDPGDGRRVARLAAVSGVRRLGRLG